MDDLLQTKLQEGVIRLLDVEKDPGVASTSSSMSVHPSFLGETNLDSS